MLTPHLVGSDVATERQIWLLKLDGLQYEFGWDDLQGQKFACLLAVDARSVPTDELSAFCSHLIGLGCGYFCVWGPDCERVHDIMEEEVIGDDPPTTDIGCLMTTSRAMESLAEAVEFFLTCTVPDGEYAPAGCAYGLAVSVGSTEWAAEIEHRLRSSTAPA